MWLTVTPLADAPSPKFHEYPVTVPSGSLDDEASKLTAWPTLGDEGAKLNDAIGLSGGVVIIGLSNLPILVKPLSV